jgi:hypothetical protein
VEIPTFRLCRRYTDPSISPARETKSLPVRPIVPTIQDVPCVTATLLSVSIAKSPAMDDLPYYSCPTQTTGFCWLPLDAQKWCSAARLAARQLTAFMPKDAAEGRAVLAEIVVRARGRLTTQLEKHLRRDHEIKSLEADRLAFDDSVPGKQLQMNRLRPKLTRSRAPAPVADNLERQPRWITSTRFPLGVPGGRCSSYETLKKPDQAGRPRFGGRGRIAWSGESTWSGK